MVGQRNIFAVCFQVRGLVFLQITMINYESDVLPCSKRAFSDILEGVILTNISGGTVFLPLCFDSSYKSFCVLQ